MNVELFSLHETQNLYWNELFSRQMQSWPYIPDVPAGQSDFKMTFSAASAVTTILSDVWLVQIRN